MKTKTTKKHIPATVRIWPVVKERLQNLVSEKAKIEKRNVYEVELVNKAVNDLCEIEEKKLGL